MMTLFSSFTGGGLFRHSRPPSGGHGGSGLGCWGRHPPPYKYERSGGLD
jgi:hypothetical protein